MEIMVVIVHVVLLLLTFQIGRALGRIESRFDAYKEGFEDAKKIDEDFRKKAVDIKNLIERSWESENELKN